MSGPLPVKAQVTLGRERDATLLDISGRIGGDSKVQARLLVRSRAEIDGEISLEQLSLPWLVTARAQRARICDRNRPGPRHASDRASVWSTAGR